MGRRVTSLYGNTNDNGKLIPSRRYKLRTEYRQDKELKKEFREKVLKGYTYAELARAIGMDYKSINNRFSNGNRNIEEILIYEMLGEIGHTRGEIRDIIRKYFVFSDDKTIRVDWGA